MQVASIKGLALTQLVADVVRLRDEERSAGCSLEGRLAPEALGLLDAKIEITRWYPLSAYTSLTRLLVELEAEGKTERYLRARGAAAAERALAAGLYQQLNFLQERFDPSNLSDLRTDLSLVVSLQGAFFNFSRWRVIDDPDHADRLAIELADASDFTEDLCHATAGFITCLARKVPTAPGSHWRFERPEPDRILLRTDRSLVETRAAR